MNRHSTIALAVALVAGCGNPDDVVLPSLSSTTAPAAAITGSAYFATPAGALNHVQITARRWADGRVLGEWQVASNGPVLHGNITCFTIEGDDVRVTGVVEKSNIPGVQAGYGFGWLIRDAGRDDDATRLFFNADPAVAESFCESGVSPVPLTFFDTIGGNITVHR